MRQVIIETSSLEGTQARFFNDRTPVATGLLIGRMSAKDHVLALLQTPTMADEGEGGGKGWENVDESWVVEHAREVHRMLPGGISVVGIFFFCPADQVASGGSKMNMAASILKKIGRFQRTHSSIPTERLFLHMCSKTKRNTVKAFNIQDIGKGGHPGELKLQNDVMQSFVSLTSRCKIKMSIPLPLGDEKPTEFKALSSAVKSKLQEQLLAIESSIAMVDGSLASNNPLFGDASAGGKGGKGGKGKGKGGDSSAPAGAELTVNLFSDSTSLDSSLSGKEELVIQGDILGVAHVMASESSIAASEAIKLDVSSSLSTRIGMMLEEWDLQAEEAKKPPSGSLWSKVAASASHSWALPRRLKFPFVGPIFFSQHVMNDETLPDALSNLKQLLPDVASIQEAGDAQAFLKWNESAPSGASLRPISSGGNAKAAPSGSAAPTGSSGGSMKSIFAVAAVMGLYALEYTFDVLPFI